MECGRFEGSVGVHFEVQDVRCVFVYRSVKDSDGGVLKFVYQFFLQRTFVKRKDFRASSKLSK